jgi:hypothetical protein
MRHYHVWAWLCVVLLASCGKEMPPPLPTAPSASEVLKADESAIAARFAEQRQELDAKTERDTIQAERFQRIEALRDIGRQWKAAMDEAGRSGKGELPEPMAKMEAAKNALAEAAVDTCTEKPRTTLVTAMAMILDGYKQFREQPGAASKATQDQLNEGATQLVVAERDLAACRTAS